MEKVQALALFKEEASIQINANRLGNNNMSNIIDQYKTLQSIREKQKAPLLWFLDGGTRNLTRSYGHQCAETEPRPRNESNVSPWKNICQKHNHSESAILPSKQLHHLSITEI